MPHSLTVTAPFNLEATVRVLQRHPDNRVEHFAHGRYRRAIRTAAGLTLVELQNVGSIHAPDICWAPLAGPDDDAIGTALAQMLGLHINPPPLTKLTADHPRLAATATALTGMRPPRFHGWYEAFANVIPFQQVSLAAGMAIVGRLIEHYGTWLDYDGVRYFVFPEPQTIANSDTTALRQCGLSRIKAQALLHIAQLITDGALRKADICALTSADAAKTLEKLRGIGPWSARLVLLRGLGRLDVFPPGDVGAQRGLGPLLAAETDAALTQAVAQFGRLRGFLYFFTLGRHLLDKGLISPVAATDTDGEA